MMAVVATMTVAVLVWVTAVVINAEKQQQPRTAVSRAWCNAHACSGQGICLQVVPLAVCLCVCSGQPAGLVPPFVPCRHDQDVEYLSSRVKAVRSTCQRPPSAGGDHLACTAALLEHGVTCRSCADLTLCHRCHHAHRQPGTCLRKCGDPCIPNNAAPREACVACTTAL